MDGYRIKYGNSSHIIDPLEKDVINENIITVI